MANFSDSAFQEEILLAMPVGLPWFTFHPIFGISRMDSLSDFCFIFPLAVSDEELNLERDELSKITCISRRLFRSNQVSANTSVTVFLKPMSYFLLGAKIRCDKTMHFLWKCKSHGV